MEAINAAMERWKNSDFYKSALVLGLDIGMAGIGVWLRKGPTPIFARTYMVTLPESAPLRGRRLKRSARRSRQSRRHREVMLHQFFAKRGLPWVPVNTDAFVLRHRAITSHIASKEALVVCLRHIIRHRGFDYHLTGEGEYPWGDDLSATEATKWASAAACDPKFGGQLRYMVSDAGWSEPQRERFLAALSEAEKRYKEDPIRKVLVSHFRESKPNRRPSARRHNFPRELVWGHLEDICRRHAEFLGGENVLPDALMELEEILNYRRKKPGALAERKVKDCPFAPNLFNGKKEKCPPNADLAVRRFKLLEFLASRTFVATDGSRHHATKEVFDWLLAHVGLDTEAVRERKPRPPTPKRTELAKKAGLKLAKDDASHNKDYFDQLHDLLRPDLSVLAKRSSISSASAERLSQKALADGYDPESIRANLQDYYNWRRDPSLGFGVYPQVTFLLGPAKCNDKEAVHGVLKRLLADPAILAQTGGATVPDFVVVETIGDIPRNTLQRKEIQAEMKQRRAFKDALMKKHHVPENASDQDRKKVLLFDQQRGLCPYTGKELGNPLAANLQVDHIFPRERGGIGEMVNLVLTHAKTNGEKGKRTPFEAFGREILRQHSSAMQWNSRKREMFLREERDCPNWQNTTRIAQLARQLRHEIAGWLGIQGKPEEIARRIGTPTGFQTAVCRESWKERLPSKDRRNLRHHLWDAAVLSHIPPGPGLNHALHGGIFFYEDGEPRRATQMLALPALGPDVAAFEKSTASLCLVARPRQKRSRASRFDETIYGRRGDGSLWCRKALRNEQDGGPVKSAEQMLEEAGIPPKLLTRSLLDRWLSSTGNEPLVLSNGTVVKKVPAQWNDEAEASLVAHRNAAGKVIGFKIAREAYLRLEVWRGIVKDKRTGKDKEVFDTRLVPHPRNIANLKRRGAWRGLDSLKHPFMRKVGQFQKGDLYRIPLSAIGDVCAKGESPFVQLWYRVENFRTNGQVEFRLAEFADAKATLVTQAKKDISAQKPSSPSVLATILAGRQDDSPPRPGS